MKPLVVLGFGWYKGPLSVWDLFDFNFEKQSTLRKALKNCRGSWNLVATMKSRLDI